jgi:hypothetical protein
LLLTILLLNFWEQDTKATSAPTVPPPTLASAVDRDISAVKKQIIDVASEEKFNFAPATLNIPGSHYKSVRSFAVLVKHVCFFA